MPKYLYLPPGGREGPGDRDHVPGVADVAPPRAHLGLYSLWRHRHDYRASGEGGLYFVFVSSISVSVSISVSISVSVSVSESVYVPVSVSVSV